MSDVLAQARAAVRGLRTCFVCQSSQPDTIKISASHISWRASTKRVCVECVAGRAWSLKATAAPDDPLLGYLSKYAPLFTFFPLYVAKCLMGHHRHPPRNGKGTYACMRDWREIAHMNWRLKGEVI